VSISAHIKTGRQADVSRSSGQCPHVVRGILCHCPGCRSRRLCPCDDSKWECTSALGAGFSVRERGWATLLARVKAGAVDDPHHASLRGRCSLGDGGRVALLRYRRRDRRGVGYAARAQLHRHTTAGYTCRGGGAAVLADPPRRYPRPQRRAAPLARGLASVRGASPRSSGPWQPALAGRVVPIPADLARHMGGHP
jgi:hypothetical protein